MSIYVPLVSRL